MNDSYQPKIAILMATYNGEKYIEKQLESIEKQTYKNWRIYISDDGSTDNTINILNKFKKEWGDEKIEIRKGPQKGFCQNFLSLAADKKIISDYYAFSDQDDVWKSEKIERAISFLKVIDNNGLPNAYGSRTEIVNEYLETIGFSPLFKSKPSFQNALVQSITGGNTQVFNHLAKVLIENSFNQNPVSHDWWLYQLVTGAGGEYIYDAFPSVLYRQHQASLVGANSSITSKIKRLKKALDGQLKQWNVINFNCLNNLNNILTEDNQKKLKDIINLQNSHFIKRISILKKSGLYRQTKSGTISLWIATILNKI